MYNTFYGAPCIRHHHLHQVYTYPEWSGRKFIAPDIFFISIKTLSRYLSQGIFGKIVSSLAPTDMSCKEYALHPSASWNVLLRQKPKSGFSYSRLSWLADNLINWILLPDVCLQSIIPYSVNRVKTVNTSSFTLFGLAYALLVERAMPRVEVRFLFLSRS